MQDSSASHQLIGELDLLTMFAVLMLFKVIIWQMRWRAEWLFVLTALVSYFVSVQNTQTIYRCIQLMKLARIRSCAQILQPRQQ